MLLVVSTIVYSFCVYDFVSLNRHVWQCQAHLEEFKPGTGYKRAKPNKLQVNLTVFAGRFAKGYKGFAHIKHMRDEITTEKVQNATRNIARSSRVNSQLLNGGE